MSVHKRTYDELLAENSALRNQIKDLENRVSSEHVDDEDCRHTLDHLMEGCQMVDFNWRYLYVNDAVCRHARKECEDLLGKTMMEVFPGIEDTELFTVMKTCMEERVDQKMVNPFTYEDGTVGWFELQIQPVPLGLFVLSVDITKRMEIQLELARQEQTLSLFVQHAPAALAMFDDQLRYMAVSQRWLTDYNIADMNLIGRYHYEAFPDLLDDGLKEVHRRGMLGERISENATKRTRRDGSIQWLDWEMLPWYGPDGKIGGIIISTEDVTEKKQLQMELEEKERTMELFIHHAPAALAMFDREMRFLAVSQRWINDYGLEEREVVGRTHYEVFPGLPERIKAVHQRGLTGEVISEQNDPYLREDGTIQWRDWEVMPWYQDADEVGGIIIFTENVTEKKQLQLQLEEKEQTLELFIQHAPAGLAMFDRQMNYISVSQRWVDIFHLSGKESIIGRSHYEVFPEIPEVIKEIHQRGMAGEVVTDRNSQFVREDGIVQWLDWEMRPWYEHDGEVGGIIIFVEDVTERRSMMERLRDSEAQFRTMIEQTPAIIYVAALDDTSTTLYLSPQVEEMLGFSVEEYKSDPDIWVDQLHPLDRKRVLDELEHSHKTGEKFISEYRMFSKDWKQIWIHDTADVVCDDDGNPLFLQGMMLDITDRKLKEESLQHYVQRMEILLDIEKGISSTLDLKQVLDIIMVGLARVVFYHSISVQLFHGDVLEVIACDGFDSPEKIIGMRYPIEPGYPNYEVVTQQKYLALDDVVETYPLFQSKLAQNQLRYIHSWLGLPLISEGVVIGMITIDRDLVQPYTEEEIQMAVTIANHAAMVIDNARLVADAQKRLERLNSLQQIDRAIVRNFDLEAMLEVLLIEVRNRLQVDAADVLLYNPETDMLEYATGNGFRKEEIRISPLKLGEGYSGSAALMNMVVNIEDFSTADPPFTRMNVVEADEFVCFWSVPLVAKDQIMGVLEIFHRSPMKASSEWMNFLEALGGQAAIAVHTAQLFNDLENSNQNLTFAYDATIEGWSRAMDLRDKETEGHTERVSDLTVELTRKMNFSEEEIVHARRGALLHDMGKLGIPDSILLKPGPLTAEEWARMKTHPQLAYEMLSGIEYLKPALDIPYCHHEKWDGSGYPRGLKGEEIPLAARIFAVVDVWDAVRSDRPYRPAWSKEKALAYIKELSGVQFDPQVVELFVEMVE